AVPSRSYVAWAATPLMEHVVRLGIVGNGRTELAPITMDKFVVLVTAESSPSATEPKGKLVLRGASPSTRLQPPDLMQFMIGAAPESTATHAHHDHMSMSALADSVRWTTVPMPANIAMLPAEMLLKPTVAPYLPMPSTSAPAAVPHQTLRLKSGDTLRLTAGIVHRSF